jgi:hypothetical protein
MSMLGAFKESGARRRVLTRLAVVSAAAATLFPRLAGAQDSRISMSAGLGTFVGFTFGPRQGVEWGFEAFATRTTEIGLCTNSPRSGLGGFAQFGLIGLRDPRMTMAALGGKELQRDGLSLTGEVGFTYRFGSEPGPGIHLGLSPALSFFNTFARAQLLLDDYALGVGARVLPTYGSPGLLCVVGRPLRTEEGLARVVSRGHRLAGMPRGSVGAGDSRRELAGRAWERDAQYECASVPAFLDLAEALLACGAPLHLVDQALDAACDEMVHARISAQLASHYLGEPISPTLPSSLRRTPLAGKPGLLRLAVESWVDGCLGEGAAARQAARARELAADPAARGVLERIEADETRHAELGWRVLQWAMRSGGADARDAVRSLRNVEPIPVGAAKARDDLGAFGRLPAVEMNAVAERNLGESRRRLDGWLGAAV